MQSIKQQISQLFRDTVQTNYHIDIDPIIQRTNRPEFGDFQANFALSLAKRIHKTPVEIAAHILSTLTPHPYFESLTVSGPGFINIVINKAFLEKNLNELAHSPRLGVDLHHATRTIVVDYGGANVAKEMHVGHLRSAIIGDAFVRLFTYLGHHVIRQNHIGDWGTQFGMLIQYILDLPIEKQQQQALAHLNDLYKEAKTHFDNDPEFAEKARARVVLLQAGDPTSLAIWQTLVTLSLAHFETVYTKLGVLLSQADIAGESSYNDKLLPLVSALKEKGIAYNNQGAVVIDLDDFHDPDGKPLPFIIQKKDGGFLYATTDLAALAYRLDKLKADQIIYVVDNRQKQHFEMLFAAARKAFTLPETIQVQHTGYGAVLGEDQKPLKTRHGESIKLIDLLDEAVKRAESVIKEKQQGLSDAEKAEIARIVGIGALKYADLRIDMNKDYVFNWSRMLAFEGNTGPYLQNAYVRIMAIFRKGQLTPEMALKYTAGIQTAEEKQLALLLLMLPEVLKTVGENLHLHSLCDYLFDLATAFHRFYEHCPILNESQQPIKESRLLLSSLTARILALGLNLLGIDVLDKM